MEEEIEKIYIDEALKEGKVDYQREYESKEDTSNRGNYITKFDRKEVRKGCFIQLKK